MTPDDKIRTARAVQYRKVREIPIVTTKGGPEDKPPHLNPPIPTRDPKLRQFDTLHPKLGIGDGEATYFSCLERGYGIDMAQRVVEWERNHPGTGEEIAVTDRYLARNARPWERLLPTDAPAVVQLPPYLPPLSFEPPPDYPSPRSLYMGEQSQLRLPTRKLRKFKLRSPTGSPPPRPTCEVLDHHFKKTERAETRKHPPVSYLTETFLRDERHRREAMERLERRRKEQEKEKAKQEKETAVAKGLDDVPNYIKDLARSWRAKYPGPDKLFRKDFNFEPKTQTDEEDDCRRPLSPHSSRSLIPAVFPDARSTSLKRQRYDSFNTDVARVSPHDRSRTASLPIPTQRSEPTTQTSRSFFKGLGQPEAHPGQLVNYTLQAEPRFEVHRNDQDRGRTVASDYNLDDVTNNFQTRSFGPVEHVRGHWTPSRPQLIDRGSHYGEDPGHHLDDVFSQQGKLGDSVDEAQVAVDEIRMKTCELQRRTWIARDQPPMLFKPILRTRRAQPQATRWPPMRASNLTHTWTNASTTEQMEQCARRRSYVARCRSTDVFLRDMRESQRIRQLMREADRERPRLGTPDPVSSEAEDDWLGDDPL
jgi:hypothetical protein